MNIIPPRTLSLSTALLLAALTGCNQAPESHHTVSWYVEHKAERDTKVTWCRDDAARASSVDCTNALKAQQHARLTGPGSLETLTLDPNWKPGADHRAASK